MFIYRLLLTLMAPLVALWFALRILRGRERWGDLGERLGLSLPPLPQGGPRLWLHGASNGELTSARGLIGALLDRDPALDIVVTSNSLTGRDMVRGWGMARLQARLAPLDYHFALGRFLRGFRPCGLVVLEGDLWPNRFDRAARAGLPVAMISARISARSFATWRRTGALGRRMMGALTLLSAQDAASEARFRALGLPQAALLAGATLKSSVRLPAPDPAALAPFRSVFAREDTFLAASTHAGEEEQVIRAFEQARAARPGLRMILAPRHPARGTEVAGLLAAAGLRFATRSAGEAPGPETEVYLADTLGEMALWYALSGACFVGASLVDKGGHTPFEPAGFGCAILHGPYLSNFAAPYRLLAEAGGAIAVQTADGLGAALAGLHASEQGRLAHAARNALATEGADDLAPLVAALAEAMGLARPFSGIPASPDNDPTRP